MMRTETAVGAGGGAIIGYILWLIAVSIGVANSTVGRWSVVLLIASGAVGVGSEGVAWGLRRRRNYPWAAFAFWLPILPVVLSLCVLTAAYL